MADVFELGFRRVLSLVRWWGPLLGYMGLIFALSSRPQPELFLKAPDYVLHFVAYFFLAVLAVRAFARGLIPPMKNSAVLLGLALSFIYALSDEWHQSFVPGRIASGRDLLADGLGVLAAWGAFLILWHRMRSVAPMDRCYSAASPQPENYARSGDRSAVSIQHSARGTRCFTPRSGISCQIGKNIGNRNSRGVRSE